MRGDYNTAKYILKKCFDNTQGEGYFCVFFCVLCAPPSPLLLCA